MKTFFSILFVNILITTSVSAQVAPTREIGLRMSNFNSIGMVYKKQMRENTFRRYRLAFGNLSANFDQNTSLFSLSAGGAIGKEKRRSVNDKLQFIYGTELIASVTLYSGVNGPVTIDTGNGGSTTITGSNRFLASPSIGIGFVLGAQYNFNPRWYLSAELIPSIIATGTFANGNSIYSINAGFNSGSAGVTGAYRF
ncbi:hypothetical protein IC229_15755 [Spirosoma sp. BT702]|uniref:Outer membrane protein beta-barrel domain-containing protein n=1 Tax=Spirosoma profusum TaxID=2771354 RepID=A0A926XXX2_9BACT|nr:hypothetical protein [Spirosoma profusum]MBD2702106.1 hypothetical protein [Spirosoma profusum]